MTPTITATTYAGSRTRTHALVVTTSCDRMTH